MLSMTKMFRIQSDPGIDVFRPRLLRDAEQGSHLGRKAGKRIGNGIGKEMGPLAAATTWADEAKASLAYSSQSAFGSGVEVSDSFRPLAGV